jgi:hypothetical protein
VSKSRGGDGLTTKAFGCLWVKSEMLVEYLHGDRVADQDAGRPVNITHGSRTQLCLDTILVLEHLTDVAALRHKLRLARRKGIAAFTAKLTCVQIFVAALWAEHL